MPMQPPTTLEWREPLAYLDALAGTDEEYAFLYSGMKTDYSGRYSLLALHPEQVIEADSFSPLHEALTTAMPPYANCWLGYLGYGLKNCVEALHYDAPSYIDLPILRMTRFHTLLVFDHEMHTLHCHRLTDTSFPLPIPNPTYAPPEWEISELSSDMTKEEYLSRVMAIKEAIAAGSLYQANLTRKFYGTFSTHPCPVQLFKRLSAVSPATYSALLRFGDTAVISSSPEQFLKLGSDGYVETRPIKGSAPLNVSAETLANSEKDRAENLMIVDLMRNDLARSCEVGSVKTHDLFEVTTYATVHHMASTVTGTRKPDVSPLQLIECCFPPGSMTGAPKIRAMELCSQLEPRARGVYSGAIGWLGGDGSGELSVVIRTLVMQGKRFEFQVGGGIVQDSTPIGEWEETLTKARGIAQALGIRMEELERL